MKRVWIELEKPQSAAEAAEIVKAANTMLAKLGASQPVFEYMEDKRTYIRMLPDNAGFFYLNDNGDWFNLDALSA
jgi:hypothetical protein